jgi:hypothetical protein
VVDGDVDISQAVAALAPFGKKYVDELARACLVLDDKDYLPLILKKIAATVKRDRQGFRQHGPDRWSTGSRFARRCAGQNGAVEGKPNTGSASGRR